MKRWVLAPVAIAAVVGCDPAEDVQVQPLPALDQSSPESRLGLPEVAGLWRFAGWELEEGDTGRLAGDLPSFGQIRLETQRLDSIAGAYVAGGGQMPLVGEVRRDGILALAGAGRYLTGRVSGDTLWLVTTTLLESSAWPGDARAAFVRTPVQTAFVRVRGALPPMAAADTLLGDTSATAIPLVDGAVPPAAVGRPPARGATVGTADERRAPVRADDAPPAEPRTAEPEPTPPPVEPRREEPEPEVTPPPRRSRPQLLGVPVDSTSRRPRR